MTMTLVYKYAITPLGNMAARRAVTDHPVITEQLVMGHQLRNKLVEVEHGHEAAMKELWSQHPVVAATEATVQTTEAEVLTLLERARSEHSQDHTNKTRKGTAAEIATARKALKTARGARRQAISEAYPLVKPKIEDLRKQYKLAIKNLYAEYCTGRGLYWATYNQIVRNHTVSVKKVMAARKAGKPSQLWFKRWDGTGTITIQLQRQAKDPVRSPEMLASETGTWRNVLRLPAPIPADTWEGMTRGERVRAGRGVLRWTVGGGRSVELPIQMHRPIPPQADIAMATLTRTITGGVAHLHVALTVKLPAPEPVEGPPVAVHMGWRQRPDGSVRVATWAAHKPVTVPPHLESNVLIHDTGRTGEIVYQARDLKIAERPAHLVSVRDKARAPVQEAVALWVGTTEYRINPEDPETTLTSSVVRKWRSSRHMAKLARTWRHDGAPETAPPELVQMVEAWYKQDCHLYPWEANEREQNINYRNDRWRKVAFWLTTHTGMVVLDNTDLASIRRKSDPGETDPTMPAEVATQARNRAVTVAPGYLRSAIASTAARKGVTVAEVSSVGLTRIHQKCGYEAEAHPRFAAAAVVVCPGCGDSYDQDFNAVKMMLQRAVDGQITLVHDPRAVTTTAEEEDTDMQEPVGNEQA